MKSKISGKGKVSRLAPLEVYDCAAFNEYVHRKHPDLWKYLEGSGVEAKRGPKQQADLKRLGYKKGTPDFRYIEPRGGYLGLIMEAKRRKPAGRAPTPEQKERLALYEQVGHKVEVCYGYEELVEAFEAYIEMAPL